MKLRTLVALAGLLASPVLAAEPNTLSDAEKAAGWRLLFDGQNPGVSFRNYKQPAISDGWAAENGALVWKRKGAGDIITKDQFENFEFSVEWKISEGGNSGVMFRVQESGAQPWNTGPEAQIQDNVKGHDPQKAGWLYQFYQATTDATKPVGEWNHFRLVVNHNKCEHWMNGVKYVEYEIGSPDWEERFAKSKFSKFPDFARIAKGHICLQDHGNEVAFRNIKIRVLP